MPSPSVHVGEIHVPGASRQVGARTFILTSPAQPGRRDVELFFGFFAADAPRKVVEKLCERLTEETRPVFFQKGLDAEARFEAALKDVNRVILGFLHDHGLSIPGIQLRGAVGALVEGRLLISSRGRLNGFLVLPQGARFAVYDLFDGAADRQNNPKFFSSLQVGPFAAGARLFVATAELLETLDDAFVRRVFADPDTAAGARDLKNALKTSKQPISLLTLETPLETAAQPAPARPRPAAAARTVPSSRQERARAENVPLAGGADPGELASRGLRAVGTAIFAAIRFLPGLVANAFRGLWRILKTIAKAPVALASLLIPARRQAAFARVAEGHERFVAGAADRLNRLPPHRRIHALLMLVGAILCIHGLVFIIHRQAVVGEAKAYEARITEFQQLGTDLDTSLIYGNDRHAREVYGRMRTIADALPSATPEQAKIKDDGERTLSDALSKLRRIVDAGRPDVVASLDDPSGDFKDADLVRFKDALYLFSETKPLVATVSATGTVPTGLPGFHGGVAAAAPANTGILLLDQDGRIYFWNPAGRTMTSYPDAKLQDGGPILFYQGRLYGRQADQSIVKLVVLNRKLGSPSGVTTASQLPDVSGLAADGAIYLLGADGQLKKFTHGQPVAEFQPPVIDPQPRHASDLHADAVSNWLTFIDRGGDRVYVIDKKTGRLAAQLASPDFTGLEAMTASEDGQTLYLLAGGKVLSAPLRTVAGP